MCSRRQWGKHFSVNAELAFNIPWREQFSALWHIVMTSRNANPPDCFRNQRKQFFRGRDNDGVTLNFHVFPPSSVLLSANRATNSHSEIARIPHSFFVTPDCTVSNAKLLCYASVR